MDSKPMKDVKKIKSKYLFETDQELWSSDVHLFFIFVHREIELNEDLNSVANSLTKLMGKRVSEANYISFACWSLTFVKKVYENEFDLLMNRNVKLVKKKKQWRQLHNSSNYSSITAGEFCSLLLWFLFIRIFALSLKYS